MSNQSYVLLLRGINVGGNNRLPMNDLKEMLGHQGLEGVQHYIQSGNLVFRTGDESTEKLEQQIENGIEGQFGFRVPAMVLKQSDFEAAVESFPFSPDEAEKSLIVFLSGNGSDEWADRAKEHLNNGERYERIEDIAYLYCPKGIGRSKAAETMLTKPRSGVKATSRNWRTVNRILGMLAELE